MQNHTSKDAITALYNSGNYSCSYHVKINDVDYAEDQFFSIKTSHSLLDSGSGASVGNVISKQITIEMKNPSETIPKMAKIQPFVTLTNTEDTTESYEIPKGVFYIDTREINKQSGKLTLTGYDKILMLDQDYVSSYTEATYLRNIVDDIRKKAGLGASANRYPIDTPVQNAKIQFTAGTYTMREVLGFCAGMGLGNYVLSDDGTEALRFVPLWGEVTTRTDYGSHDIGGRASAYEVGESLTYDGIHVTYDDNELLYPTTSVSPFEASYPDMLNTVANTVYKHIKDWTYKTCSLTGAKINPLAELGDYITVTKDGTSETFQIFNADANYQRLFNVDINNTEASEVEHEYSSYTSKEKKEWVRRLKSTAAEFTVKTNAITAKVTENTTNITTNSENISTNSTNISKNTEDIETNAQSISDTASKLSELSVTVDGVSAKVTQTQETIEGEVAENIIPYPYYSAAKTDNGITYSYNLDGSINVSGTATSSVWIYPAYSAQGGIGTYYAHGGSPVENISFTFAMKGDNEDSWHYYGTSVKDGYLKVETDNPITWRMYYYIKSGTAIDGTIVLRPALYKDINSNTWKSPVQNVASQFKVQSGLISSKVSLTDFTGNTVVSKINQSATTVQIAASKVNLSGYVTITDLAASGTTTINGANIKTGTISADRLELSDYVTITDLKTGGSTVINGSNITTGTINANLITSGTLSADRIEGGTFKIGGSDDKYGVLNLYDSNNQLGMKIDNFGRSYYDSGTLIVSEYVHKHSGNIIHEINATSGKIAEYNLNFGTGTIGCYHNSNGVRIPWWEIYISSSDNAVHLNLYDSSGSIRAYL